uniref:Leucine-rich repeat-containing N-terminal plant-type domain-containing protein n=1 Tax=Lactuca sativa TaxID=4236 RepID=A0A9R1WUL0_LACSA|nr:hypothetical protein LSAT_V11C800442580 [Lactuca sativa]
MVTFVEMYFATNCFIKITFLVGGFQDLEYLDLFQNRLTRKNPNCFKNLQYLETMRFNSNRLRGVLPNWIALQFLSKLRLNNNNFIVLDVGDNKLSGNIPKWIGDVFIFDCFKVTP